MVKANISIGIIKTSVFKIISDNNPGHKFDNFRHKNDKSCLVFVLESVFNQNSVSDAH